MVRNVLVGLVVLGSFWCSGNYASAQKTIRVGKCTVYSTKSSGAAWDIGEGAPDLVVQIRVKKFLSSFKSTSKKANTYSATFNEDTIRIKPGQSIEINVIDKDLASDDFIGKGTFVIDEDTYNSGSVELFAFQRVRSLTLYFR